MHVLYFHQHFSTPHGSTGTRSYEMAKKLIARGHVVTMVCGSSGVAATGLSGEPTRGLRRGKVDDIDVIEICLPYSNYDSFLRRSITFVRFALRSIGIAVRTDYDLLFATSTPLTAGIPGVVMRILKRRKPFVFEVRDLWPELPKAMGAIRNPIALATMSFLEWITYRCASACVALAPATVEGIRRRSSPDKPVAMVPNGSDLALFAPGTLSVAGADHTMSVIFTGAHGLTNGLDVVLDSARILMDRGRKDIELLFIGDGREKPHLRRRTEQENLSNCTFRDPLPKTELARTLGNAGAGMMVLANVPEFYYATSPNKFFDYIASGLPVVNNYPGWLADMITQYECGIVVPPDDPESFADALTKLADNPDMRKTMGRNARMLAENRFDREKQADKLAQFLEYVFDPGGATPVPSPDEAAC